MARDPDYFFKRKSQFEPRYDWINSNFVPGQPYYWFKPWGRRDRSGNTFGSFEKIPTTWNHYYDYVLGPYYEMLNTNIEKEKLLNKQMDEILQMVCEENWNDFVSFYKEYILDIFVFYNIETDEDYCKSLDTLYDIFISKSKTKILKEKDKYDYIANIMNFINNIKNNSDVLMLLCEKKFKIDVSNAICQTRTFYIENMIKKEYKTKHTIKAFHLKKKELKTKEEKYKYFIENVGHLFDIEKGEKFFKSLFKIKEE